MKVILEAILAIRIALMDTIKMITLNNVKNAIKHVRNALVNLRQIVLNVQLITFLKDKTVLISAQQENVIL